ncbi:NupC/NupG family nucleoside CNT transporter [Vibrio cincinnatiensis]|jgi:CNT family concentrative nucleoside transporter|uniref:Nucleoside permease n=1 Tax=Vibrio cincinnatiensis DSM 19608 TaxID=1123491 RepID=A0A1T4N525_VIBCI|nr:NupC/NupG family nucleoside CNT transporter [Vibrio cincinnatiensis]MCG3724990.1 NupC/NupG family nucleoside CNT transporter [Vibrio cincinnatiensis]MCG3731898.1 NupC/NupG family nucleoside CNT transporter [Vibrio cincinnatiensis]MCG3739292.1 NupC/NupG family nucleoside CNT transporter [Vibrio cincinnatiensis]MCG3743233.1 NupC/NupG family nucleoside CNT transporter [Vibrio cincinnatiensis]MCG3759207.1 NupC/NupG family nucleoside CNT transporter [Vibrio cincinnatiensis]
MSLFMSLIGMAVLLAIAVLLSSNRKAINLRTVGGAFAIQFSLGAFILYVPWGQELLRGFSDAVSNVINYGNDGTGFLFGNLVNFSVEGLGFIFAFKVLPTLIFFSALISVLYYIGVMQWVIRILGGGLQKALGTSRAESMSAAANIFVGQTEAPLVVRPFVPKMTQSELFAVMCGGLASIAGGVLAGYASMGVKIEYLVAASFMAAPGGLLFAKIIMPETDKPVDQIEGIEAAENEKPANVIDAAAGGASAGLQLALNVGAMLIAFIGLIALINGMLGGIGGWFGMPELTLEMILGLIFAPLAFLLGVPWAEAQVAGEFIGLKTVANEFVAYSQFAPYLGDAAPAVLTEKTKAIISFALCGFANLSSIAILLGGLGSLAPSRRGDIARMGIKAVIAGTLSNLMAATIAGFFLSF